jgi:hypothetical protein
MKKFYLLTFIFYLNLVCAQETEFTFTKDGFTDYVVIQCTDKTKEEIYKKTINWINFTYKNPNKVILAKIENDYIRIQGFASDILCFNTLGKNCYNADYQIEVSFKDGKYKFDLIEVNLLGTQSDPKIELVDMNVYFKKDGKIKSNYKYFIEPFLKYFNGLNSSLENFIKENAVPQKGDW